MDFKNYLILNFLEKIFDSPKKDKGELIEYEYNCITETCKNDIDKYNLSYNLNKNKFKCWKCNYKGNLISLVKKFGDKDDYDMLSPIISDLKSQINYDDLSKEKIIEKEIKLELPESFEFFYNSKDSFHKKNALNYLLNRGISEKEIKKYKLGFTTKGKYKFRIIIPYYDKNNNLLYFDSRSFYPNIKPDYLKPDSKIIKKSDIIFNEELVSFDVPIFLVEGVFDMFPLYNCIPLLGKRINNKLLHKIIKYKTSVILCLDEDALKDVIGIYFLLNSFGINVYWCPIKNDISKIYEKYGKEGVINTLKNIKKINFKVLLELKILSNEQKGNVFDISNKELEKEWELIQRALKK
jgi:DNA primase